MGILLMNHAFPLLHPNRGRFQLVITLSATIQLDLWQSCSDLPRVDQMECGLPQLVKAVSVRFNELRKEWANLASDATKTTLTF